MGFLSNAVRRQVHAAYAVAVLALIRGASPSDRSAPSERVKCLWSPPYPTLILCVYTARMACPPYLLPPRSHVCSVCGHGAFTLYACPAHMMSCTHMPMAIPTYHQRTPMAATGPCGSCVTMPAWACNGGVLWWLRSSTRYTSSSSSTHIHDTLPNESPYTRPRIWHHLVRSSIVLPLEYVDSEVCVPWEARASCACRQGDAACPFECEVPRIGGPARQLDACHARVLGDVV